MEGRDSTGHPHHIVSTERNAGAGNGSHTSSDTLVNRPSSETSSIVTHYTTSTQAMSRAFSDLQKAVDHDRYHTQIKAVARGDSEEDIPRISIAKRSLHQVPRFVYTYIHITYIHTYIYTSSTVILLYVCGYVLCEL